MRPGTALRRQPVERVTYRVREVAEMLGIHERTAWRWLREGRMRSVKVGGATLVPAAEVARLIHPVPAPTATAPDPEVDRVAREMLR